MIEGPKNFNTSFIPDMMIMFKQTETNFSKSLLTSLNHLAQNYWAG